MQWLIGITVIICIVILLFAWITTKAKVEPDEEVDEDLLREEAEAEAIRVRLIQRAKCILCIRKIKELNGNYDIDLDKFFCGKCVE